jgi:hypothetical protein
LSAEYGKWEEEEEPKRGMEKKKREPGERRRREDGKSASLMAASHYFTKAAFLSPDKASPLPEALHYKQSLRKQSGCHFPQANLRSRASPRHKSVDENVPLPIDQASSRKWSRAPHGVAAEPTNQRRGRAHVVSLDPGSRRQCKLSCAATLGLLLLSPG